MVSNNRTISIISITCPSVYNPHIPIVAVSVIHTDDSALAEKKKQVLLSAERRQTRLRVCGVCTCCESRTCGCARREISRHRAFTFERFRQESTYNK